MRSDYEVITAADLAPATTEDNDFSIYMGAEETRPAFKLGIFVLLLIYPLRNLL